MNSLITYIKAIHNQSAGVSVNDSESNTCSYSDDGAEITKNQTIYRFDNGVIISYTVEQDNIPSGPEVICEECWISYEVVESGPLKITPLRKVFSNRCQESFWLKVQTENSDSRV